MEKKSSVLWTIWNLVEAFILLCAGVMCILFRDKSELANWIAIAVGAFVILDGVLRVLLVLFGKKRTESSIMLVGGFEISAGIVVILQWTKVIEIIVQFLFVILIVVGALLLAFSILKIVRKESTIFVPILEIVFSAILIALGVSLCVLWYSQGASATEIILILIGSMLGLSGIGQAIVTLIQYRKQRKGKEIVKTEETPKPKEKNEPKVEPTAPEVVDVEVIEHKE